MRFIQDLSPETRSLLHRLYKQSQHHRVRQRAHCIILSSQGITTTTLMAIFSVDRITIYNWFDSWEAYHFAGLYDKKRCGRPPKLTEEERDKAQHYVVQHPRDIKKVVYLLEQDTSKRVSTKTIKRLVKKNRYVWKRIKKAPEKSPDPQQYERSKAFIQRLQAQEACGISELWYFDVSGL